MPKRLKNIVVEFISLVTMPATGLPLILKNEQAKASLFELKKADEDRQIAYGVVYAPGIVDAQGEFTDSAEIEAAAYRFMKDKKVDQVDQNHDFQPLPGAYVAESWIVKMGDPWFGELPGSWAVGIKVDDDAVWERLKKGELWGFSMAGLAEREAVATPNEMPTGGESISKARVEALETSLQAVQGVLQQVQEQLQGLTPLAALPEQLTTLTARLTTMEKQRLSIMPHPGATGAGVIRRVDFERLPPQDRKAFLDRNGQLQD